MKNLAFYGVLGAVLLFALAVKFITQEKLGINISAQTPADFIGATIVAVLIGFLAFAISREKK